MKFIIFNYISYQYLSKSIILILKCVVMIIVHYCLLGQYPSLHMRTIGRIYNRIFKKLFDLRLYSKINTKKML